MVQHELQLLDQLHGTFLGFLILLLFLQTLAQEQQIVHAMLQSITDQVFQKVLRQIHVIFQIIESNFRLDHPEFRQMPGRI